MAGAGDTNQRREEGRESRTWDTACPERSYLRVPVSRGGRKARMGEGFRRRKAEAKIQKEKMLNGLSSVLSY